MSVTRETRPKGHLQDHSLPVEMFLALYEDSVDVDGLVDPSF
jgi:hypothetical protein